MKYLSASVLSGAALVGAALAQDAGGIPPVSLGVGYTYFDADGVEFDAVSLRGGYDVTPNFGVEAEGLFGVGEESFGIEGIQADASLDYVLGGFGKVMLPLAPSAQLFARVGYVTAEIEASALGVSASESEDGFAYGVGGEYRLATRHGVRADYTRYDFDGEEADTLSVSYVARF